MQKQIQRQSKTVLKLRDIRFRKAPFLIRNHRSRYIDISSRSVGYVNKALEILYKYSGGSIGFVDAWAGKFEKIK